MALWSRDGEAPSFLSLRWQKKCWSVTRHVPRACSCLPYRERQVGPNRPLHMAPTADAPPNTGQRAPRRFQSICDCNPPLSKVAARTSPRTGSSSDNPPHLSIRSVPLAFSARSKAPRDIAVQGSLDASVFPVHRRIVQPCCRFHRHILLAKTA
ncbi:hypothetical protein GQ53DRAFT_21663 [Thozetella sp. PMI_491]|nr:hypothetical protein GQ53DRAFT_21663 [Thozetella sp. PMI_491]